MYILFIWMEKVPQQALKVNSALATAQTCNLKGHSLNTEWQLTSYSILKFPWQSQGVSTGIGWAFLPQVFPGICIPFDNKPSCRLCHDHLQWLSPFLGNYNYSKLLDHFCYNYSIFAHINSSSTHLPMFCPLQPFTTFHNLAPILFWTCPIHPTFCHA